MKSIITNIGSSVTADVFRLKMKKFVLIGSKSDNDATLNNILENNTISDTNINQQSNLSNYIMNKPEDIDNSMIDNDKTLIISVNLQPGYIDPTYYVYAIALLDETGDIYAITLFSENFNSISEAGELITIRFKLTGTEITGNEFTSISEESYITRREFIEWANNHNHDRQYTTIRHLNNIIDELDQIKENKGTIGRLEDIKSLNNNNIVNVLNEIIENLGDINSLNVSTRDSIVSAINKIYSIIGDPKKLTKFDNIIESLEDIRQIVMNSSGGVFADGVKVEDVDWADKADLTYVGDINLYHGKEKGSVVEAINEIYDETIGNNNRVHKITQISTNTNYKIFDKSQDYSGLIKITTFKNSIINSYFEVEVNTTPETIKIKNVSIKDELLNRNVIIGKDIDDVANYIYGLSIVYNDKSLYLSILTNIDNNLELMYDKIFIDFIKMNQQSILTEEPFSTKGSIAIREGAGNYKSDPYKHINIAISKKKYSLFDTSKKFESILDIKNDNKTISSIKVESDGFGDIKIDKRFIRNDKSFISEYTDRGSKLNIPIFESDGLFIIDSSILNLGRKGGKLKVYTNHNVIDNSIVVETEKNSILSITEGEKGLNYICFNISITSMQNKTEIVQFKNKWLTRSITVNVIDLRPKNKEELYSMCVSGRFDCSTIDTSLITDMSYLFYYIKQINPSFDYSGIENWDTSNVTNMEGIFCYCNDFNNHNIFSNWNFSKVENLNYAFNDCYSLDADISDLDLSSVITSKMAFTNTSIKSITINNFMCTDMSFMFYNCSKLTRISIDFSGSSGSKNCNSMCSFCSDLISFSSLNFSSITANDAAYAFLGCHRLETCPQFYFENANAREMCRECYSLKSLSFAGNFEGIINATYMFCDCYSLEDSNIIISSTTLEITSCMFYNANLERIGGIMITDNNALKKCDNMFFYANLTDSGVTFANNPNVEDLSRMFAFNYMWGYETLYKNATDLLEISFHANMFQFDRRKPYNNLVNMEEMFACCYSIDFNIDHLDLPALTNIRGIFANCKNLKYNIHNWNAPNVTESFNVVGGTRLTIPKFLDVDYSKNTSTILIFKPMFLDPDDYFAFCSNVNYDTYFEWNSRIINDLNYIRPDTYINKRLNEFEYQTDSTSTPIMNSVIIVEQKNTNLTNIGSKIIPAINSNKSAGFFFQDRNTILYLSTADDSHKGKNPFKGTGIWEVAKINLPTKNLQDGKQQFGVSNLRVEVNGCDDNGVCTTSFNSYRRLDIYNGMFNPYISSNYNYDIFCQTEKN